MICVGRKESQAQARPPVREQKSQGTQTHTETQKSLPAGAGRHRKNPRTHRFPRECNSAHTVTWDLHPPQLWENAFCRLSHQTVALCSGSPQRAAQAAVGDAALWDTGLVRARECEPLACSNHLCPQHLSGPAFTSPGSSCHLWLLHSHHSQLWEGLMFGEHCDP